MKIKINCLPFHEIHLKIAKYLTTLPFLYIYIKEVHLLIQPILKMTFYLRRCNQTIRAEISSENNRYIILITLFSNFFFLFSNSLWNNFMKYAYFRSTFMRINNKRPARFKIGIFVRRRGHLTYSN